MRRLMQLKIRVKRGVKAGSFLLLWCFARLAVAGHGDFSLEALNDSIKGHISGDFGKLMGLASIGWLIIGSVAGFNVRLLISVFVLLLAISFGPELVMSVVR